MGITLRGLRTAVTEQCADDRERQAVGLRETRKAVPEVMLPDIGQARFGVLGPVDIYS